MPAASAICSIRVPRSPWRPNSLRAASRIRSMFAAPIRDFDRRAGDRPAPPLPSAMSTPPGRTVAPLTVRSNRPQDHLMDQAVDRDAAQPLRREGVVLLHGIARSSASMRLMERACRRAGFLTLNVDYPSRKLPLEDLAAMMHPAVSAFAADL